MALASLVSAAGPLEIDHLEDLDNGFLRFTVRDNSGAVAEDDLVLERSAQLSGGWSNQSAIIEATAEGFVLTAPKPSGNSHFFRIRATNIPGGSAIAYFDMTEITRDEGSGALSVRVRFSEPYSGPVRYSFSGTANVTGLTGTVQADGEFVDIPLTVRDNSSVDELGNITLTLITDSTTGYSLGSGEGAPASTRVTVLENDAVWIGSFSSDEAGIGFSMELVRRDGVLTAKITSDGTGFIPRGATGEYPAAPSPNPVFSENTFRVTVPEISVPADERNRLGMDVILSLALEALASEAGHTLDNGILSGVAELAISQPDAPHLDRTIAGTFTLAEQPITPSSEEVTLK
ncbi:MAG: hypothetical protein ACR2RV_21885 [Verrucomicrobiales bacterium]